jgi:hypothetical protein
LRDLLGDIAMDEDEAWGRGSDDAFGDTGVGTSKPENLVGVWDDDAARLSKKKRTLGCWPSLTDRSKKSGSVSVTAFAH